jgi:diguanylate cyclase (GGDEF)-like protein
LSESEALTPFSFSGDPGEMAKFEAEKAARGEVRALSRVMGQDELERIRRAVIAAGEAAYHWVVETDEIFWSANAPALFGCSNEALATGRSFAGHLDADNFASRYDTVMRAEGADSGEGVAFQIEYLFRPDGRMGRRSLWIEDSGRWYADESGRPAEVFGVVRRIDDRHRRDQHLSFLGNCDPLTGMMNRGRMAEALSEAISVAEREVKSCGFVIAAINNLNVVNDSYGYEVADDVIIAVGRRLRQVVRAGDAIARYSGSKFGIILNNCSEGELEIACERFLTAARESVIETESGPVWAMLSIGGLTLPLHAPDSNAAMARAEEALAEARKLPSDGFIAYKPSQKRLSERSLNARCAAEIVTCLKEDRFRLAFQPIVGATTREPIMHEALLRMTDSEGDLIAAAHLIPIAEKLGLVRLIDRTVVQLAIATLLTHAEARLSFNVSGITATDPRWCRQLVDMLAAHRDVTPRITIEITETVALADLEETASFTRTLRDLGCAVAIDDFGSGYSSFRNLRALNVDLLKLDGSFCDGVSRNQDNQYFVAAFIDLARKFGIRTVAEWVQSEEDAEFLRLSGIDYLQGNYFGTASIEMPWQPSSPSPSFSLAPAIAEMPERSEPPAEAPPEPEAAPTDPEPALAEPETEAPAGDDDQPDLSRLRRALAILDRSFHPPGRSGPADAA